MIRLIEPEELAKKWHLFYKDIEKAIDHGVGESTSHDLFMECMNMNAQCWIIEDDKGNRKGVGITRFLHFSQYKQLQVVTLTGKGILKHLGECYKMIEMFAKGTGCKNVSIWGRPGWEKVLPKDYEKTYTVLVKEI